jgi:hypothetical protein
LTGESVKHTLMIKGDGTPQKSKVNTMKTIFCHRVMCLATLVSFLLLGYAGNAAAQAWHPCPDNASWNPPSSPVGCTKEIRIYNNFPVDPMHPHPIYVLLQGSLQQGHPSLGHCPVLPMLKGGGDVWLQRALEDTTNCYQVTNNYYAYINPKTGIAAGQFASVNVPWWSRGASNAPDKYVDWWNGARVYIFDDKNALNDSYMINQTTPAQLATPGVTCKGNTVDGDRDSCLSAELGIFRVAPDSMGNYNPQSPAQLNEFTFADIGPQSGNPPFATNSLNQNYNVSAVDQLYLPIAIERIASTGTPADIGYVGSTDDATVFSTKMEAFTGTTTDPTMNWPVYNNPVVNGQKLYPDAGIRVPSTYNVLNFYANPSFFQAPLQNQPLILPYSPGISTLPARVEDFMKQWTACTTGTGDCPLSAVYKPINQVFLNSYQTYVNNPACQPIPGFLQPVPNSDPPTPKLTTFLSYVYGWVPFNFNCAAPDLPVRTMPPAQFGYTPIDYIELQYNYKTDANTSQWFNPYTQFIHDPDRGGLGATPYAFSIDDSLSVQNNAGDGLILVVGGKHGLPNTNPVPPPVPVYDNWYDFAVGLGAPPTTGPAWASYQICSTGVTTDFPSPTPQGWVLGVNPKWTTTFPCTVTLTDAAGKKYQIEVKTALVPPAPIWPPWTPAAPPMNFDKSVISCPSASGVVPPAQWCTDGVNETANPNVMPPFYNISTPPPLPSDSLLGRVFGGFGARLR